MKMIPSVAIFPDITTVATAQPGKIAPSAPQGSDKSSDFASMLQETTLSNGGAPTQTQVSEDRPAPPVKLSAARNTIPPLKRKSAEQTANPRKMQQRQAAAAGQNRPIPKPALAKEPSRETVVSVALQDLQTTGAQQDATKAATTPTAPSANRSKSNTAGATVMASGNAKNLTVVSTGNRQQNTGLVVLATATQAKSEQNSSPAVVRTVPARQGAPVEGNAEADMVQQRPEPGVQQVQAEEVSLTKEVATAGNTPEAPSVSGAGEQARVSAVQQATGETAGSDSVAATGRGVQQRGKVAEPVERPSAVAANNSQQPVTATAADEVQFMQNPASTAAESTPTVTGTQVPVAVQDQAANVLATLQVASSDRTLSDQTQLAEHDVAVTAVHTSQPVVVTAPGARQSAAAAYRHPEHKVKVDEVAIDFAPMAPTGTPTAAGKEAVVMTKVSGSDEERQETTVIGSVPNAVGQDLTLVSAQAVQTAAAQASPLIAMPATQQEDVTAAPGSRQSAVTAYHLPGSGNLGAVVSRPDGTADQGLEQSLSDLQAVGEKVSIPVIQNGGQETAGQVVVTAKGNDDQPVRGAATSVATQSGTAVERLPNELMNTATTPTHTTPNPVVANTPAERDAFAQAGATGNSAEEASLNSSSIAAPERFAALAAQQLATQQQAVQQPAIQQTVVQQIVVQKSPGPLPVMPASVRQQSASQDEIAAALTTVKQVEVAAPQAALTSGPTVSLSDEVATIQSTRTDAAQNSTRPVLVETEHAQAAPESPSTLPNVRGTQTLSRQSAPEPTDSLAALSQKVVAEQVAVAQSSADLSGNSTQQETVVTTPVVLQSVARVAQQTTPRPVVVADEIQATPDTQSSARVAAGSVPDNRPQIVQVASRQQLFEQVMVPSVLNFDAAMTVAQTTQTSLPFAPKAEEFPAGSKTSTIENGGGAFSANASGEPEQATAALPTSQVFAAEGKKEQVIATSVAETYEPVSTTRGYTGQGDGLVQAPSTQQISNVVDTVLTQSGSASPAIIAEPSIRNATTVAVQKGEETTNASSTAIAGPNVATSNPGLEQSARPETTAVAGTTQTQRRPDEPVPAVMVESSFPVNNSISTSNGIEAAPVRTANRTQESAPLSAAQPVTTPVTGSSEVQASASPVAPESVVVRPEAQQTRETNSPATVMQATEKQAPAPSVSAPPIVATPATQAPVAIAPASLQTTVNQQTAPQTVATSVLEAPATAPLATALSVAARPVSTAHVATAPAAEPQTTGTVPESVAQATAPFAASPRVAATPVAAAPATAVQTTVAQVTAPQAVITPAPEVEETAPMTTAPQVAATPVTPTLVAASPVTAPEIKLAPVMAPQTAASPTTDVQTNAPLSAPQVTAAPATLAPVTAASATIPLTTVTPEPAAQTVATPATEDPASARLAAAPQVEAAPVTPAPVAATGTAPQTTVTQVPAAQTVATPATEDQASSRPAIAPQAAAAPAPVTPAPVAASANALQTTGPQVPAVQTVATPATEEQASARPTTVPQTAAEPVTPAPVAASAIAPQTTVTQVPAAQVATPATEEPAFVRPTTAPQAAAAPVTPAPVAASATVPQTTVTQAPATQTFATPATEDQASAWPATASEAVQVTPAPVATSTTAPQTTVTQAPAAQTVARQVTEDQASVRPATQSQAAATPVTPVPVVAAETAQQITVTQVPAAQTVATQAAEDKTSAGPATAPQATAAQATPAPVADVTAAPQATVTQAPAAQTVATQATEDQGSAGPAIAPQAAAAPVTPAPVAAAAAPQTTETQVPAAQTVATQATEDQASTRPATAPQVAAAPVTPVPVAAAVALQTTETQVPAAQTVATQATEDQASARPATAPQVAAAPVTPAPVAAAATAPQTTVTQAPAAQAVATPATEDQASVRPTTAPQATAAQATPAPAADVAAAPQITVTQVPVTVATQATADQASVRPATAPQVAAAPVTPAPAAAAETAPQITVTQVPAAQTFATQATEDQASVRPATAQQVAAAPASPVPVAEAATAQQTTVTQAPALQTVARQETEDQASVRSTTAPQAAAAPPTPAPVADAAAASQTTVTQAPAAQTVETQATEDQASVRPATAPQAAVEPTTPAPVAAAASAQQTTVTQVPAASTVATQTTEYEAFARPATAPQVAAAPVTPAPVADAALAPQTTETQVPAGQTVATQAPEDQTSARPVTVPQVAATPAPPAPVAAAAPAPQTTVPQTPAGQTVATQAIEDQAFAQQVAAPATSAPVTAAAPAPQTTVTQAPAAQAVAMQATEDQASAQQAAAPQVAATPVTPAPVAVAATAPQTTVTQAPAAQAVAAQAVATQATEDQASAQQATAPQVAAGPATSAPVAAVPATEPMVTEEKKQHVTSTEEIEVLAPEVTASPKPATNDSFAPIGNTQDKPGAISVGPQNSPVADTVQDVSSQIPSSSVIETVSAVHVDPVASAPTVQAVQESNTAPLASPSEQAKTAQNDFSTSDSTQQQGSVPGTVADPNVGTADLVTTAAVTSLADAVQTTPQVIVAPAQSDKDAVEAVSTAPTPVSLVTEVQQSSVESTVLSSDKVVEVTSVPGGNESQKSSASSELPVGTAPSATASPVAAHESVTTAETRPEQTGVGATLTNTAVADTVDTMVGLSSSAVVADSPVKASIATVAVSEIEPSEVSSPKPEDEHTTAAPIEQATKIIAEQGDTTVSPQPLESVAAVAIADSPQHIPASATVSNGAAQEIPKASATGVVTQANQVDVEVAQPIAGSVSPEVPAQQPVAASQSEITNIGPAIQSVPPTAEQEIASAALPAEQVTAAQLSTSPAATAHDFRTAPDVTTQRTGEEATSVDRQNVKVADTEKVAAPTPASGVAPNEPAVSASLVTAVGEIEQPSVSVLKEESGQESASSVQPVVPQTTQVTTARETTQTPNAAQQQQSEAVTVVQQNVAITDSVTEQMPAPGTVVPAPVQAMQKAVVPESVAMPDSAAANLVKTTDNSVTPETAVQVPITASKGMAAGNAPEGSPVQLDEGGQAPAEVTSVQTTAIPAASVQEAGTTTIGSNQNNDAVVAAASDKNDNVVVQTTSGPASMAADREQVSNEPAATTTVAINANSEAEQSKLFAQQEVNDQVTTGSMELVAQAPPVQEIVVTTPDSMQQMSGAISAKGPDMSTVDSSPEQAVAPEKQVPAMSGNTQQEGIAVPPGTRQSAAAAYLFPEQTAAVDDAVASSVQTVTKPMSATAEIKGVDQPGPSQASDKAGDASSHERNAASPLQQPGPVETVPLPVSDVQQGSNVAAVSEASSDAMASNRAASTSQATDATQKELPASGEKSKPQPAPVSEQFPVDVGTSAPEGTPSSDKGMQVATDKRDSRSAEGTQKQQKAGKGGVEQIGAASKVEDAPGTKIAQTNMATKVALQQGSSGQSGSGDSEKKQHSEQQSQNKTTDQVQPTGVGLQPPVVTEVAPPEAKPTNLKSALQESILSQIKDGVVTHDDKGNGQMSLKLNPGELGELKIDIRMEDNRLKVDVQASNSTVKDLLMNNLENLKEALTNKNFTMEGFNVSTGGGGFNNPLPEEKRGPRQQSVNKPVKAGGYSDLDEVHVNYLTGDVNNLLDVRF